MVEKSVSYNKRKIHNVCTVYWEMMVLKGRNGGCGGGIQKPLVVAQEREEMPGKAPFSALGWSKH